MPEAIPMVLKSRSALAAGSAPAATLPINDAGTTYTMAQEASWIDARHYAVGRWDGSLSVFEFTASPTAGPKIAIAVNSPAEEGVQMIAALDGATAFVSSNDNQSAIVWHSPTGTWIDVVAAASLAFPAEFGVANSATTTTVDGQLYLVMGHANGWVSLWGADGVVTEWAMVAQADVRAARPVNPWGLTNVRGVVALPSDAEAGYVVTGSEDGNLTIVRVPDGRILNAVVYNPAALRGINSLAATGFSLLAANCAVGAADFNLWRYEITPKSWAITLTDRVNLAVDPTAAQVFNFDVVCAPAAGPSSFFCSTEEGALWMGQVLSDGKLSIVGNHAIPGGTLGSTICCQGKQLAATAYDLHEFVIQPPSAHPAA